MMIATYKGDIRIVLDLDGDWIIDFKNGQPLMSEFFDTTVLLYVFGEDSWYNGIVRKESEKMKSRFPEFLKTAIVSDQDVATGRSYILESLQPLKEKKIAESIEVDGEISSVYGIKWEVSITKYSGDGSRFLINWEKGVVILTTE